VPLVADLRSPAMRPRHWQQLMEATKVGGGRWGGCQGSCCAGVPARHKRPSTRALSCPPRPRPLQVSFDVSDPGFRLDDLLALELHKFEEEVRGAPAWAHHLQGLERLAAVEG
jgi:dynein heavy chain